MGGTMWRMALVLAGCASGAQSLCDRFSECDYLGGFSEDECIEGVSSCAETELLPSQRHDWERDINHCAGLSTCDEFFECWYYAPYPC